MRGQVIGGLLGGVAVWGTPGDGVMLGDQPVAVSAGDADAAFRGLYAEHGPALLRLAAALTGGDRGRAEDLVQETMLRAWTHRGSLDLQHRSPRAWLITIARRLAIDADRARRARPQETGLDEHLAAAGGQRADACIDEYGVRAAIAALPGPQRQVLTEVFTATGRQPKRRAYCRSRPARSDRAPSTGCARCATPWQHTMRWPSPGGHAVARVTGRAGPRASLAASWPGPAAEAALRTLPTDRRRC